MVGSAEAETEGLASGPATADQTLFGEYPTSSQVIQEEISNQGYALCNGLVLTALTANT